MAIQIRSKIVKQEVIKPEKVQSELLPATAAPLLERDDVLEGTTYKFKTPMSEHAMYVTINDVVIGRGKDERRRPFEIFINSKNMDHFQWIVALTRVISAVFRQGGDVVFLVEELKAVFDPRGGYYKKGGKYMPSLVAEIGEVIQQHLIASGMTEEQIATPELKAKRIKAHETLGDESIKNANICPKCNAKALVRMDNCDTCLDCGYSKCG